MLDEKYRDYSQAQERWDDKIKMDVKEIVVNVRNWMD